MHNWTFCRSPIWNTSLTWNTSSPDFTPCFHNTVLAYAPFVFIMILTPVQLLWCSRSGNVSVPWNKCNVSKVIANVLLILVSFSSIVFEAISGDNQISKVISVVSFWIAMILVLFLSLHLKKRGMTGSGIIFLFWSLCLATKGFILISVLKSELWRGDEIVTNITEFCLIFILFLLHFWPDPIPSYRNLNSTKFAPYYWTSFPSKIFFGWVTKTVYLGWKKTLDFSDLDGLDPDNSSEEISRKWKSNWEKQKPNRKGFRNIVPVIWKSFWKTYVLAVIFELLSILMELVRVYSNCFKLIMQCSSLTYELTNMPLIQKISYNIFTL